MTKIEVVRLVFGKLPVGCLSATLFWVRTLDAKVSPEIEPVDHP